MTRIKALAASMAVALSSGLLLGSSIALADNVSNMLDGSVDASLEVMNLVKSGADGSVNYGITATDGDGVDGCNLSSTASLTVNVHSSNSAVASVTPASLTFTNCTDLKTVSVKPLTAGQVEITLSQTANASSGFFNLSGSSFTAIVAEVPPVDTTAPAIVATLSPAANSDGWHKSDVTVSWSVTDPESSILSKSGCDTSMHTDETRGLILTCTATSAGGTSSKSIMLKIDKTAPRVLIDAPRNGAEYELNQKVQARWFAIDAMSRVTSTGTVGFGQLIDTSTVGDYAFSVTATDRAGNEKTLTVHYTVKADNDDDDEDDNDHGDEDEDHDHDRPGHSGISICHKGKHSIKIAAPAVRAHLRHGDKIGDCD